MAVTRYRRCFGMAMSFAVMGYHFQVKVSSTEDVECIYQKLRSEDRLGFTSNRPVSCYDQHFACSLIRRIVVQALSEPALDFCDTHRLALCVIGDLVSVDFAEAEISRLRMGEIEATHARTRPHGE